MLWQFFILLFLGAIEYIKKKPYLCSFKTYLQDQAWSEEGKTIILRGLSLPP